MLFALPLAFVASVAFADPGPSIKHQPIATAQLNHPVELRALIVSNTSFAIYNPIAYVRPAGVPSFTRIDLQPVKDVPDIFAATIPAELITGPFDYYLEAFDKDGNGPSWWSSQAKPWHVSVTADAIDGKANAVTTSSAGSSSSSLPSYLLTGAGGVAAIGGGVTLVLGLNDLNAWQSDSLTTYQHIFGGQVLPPSKLDQLHHSANLEITAGSLIAGAGLLTASVGLFLLLHPERPDSSTEHLTRIERHDHDHNPRLASLLFDF